MSNQNWLSHFPVVFQEETCPIPEKMKELCIRREEFRTKGEIFGCTGHSYNIDKLISDKSLVEKALFEMESNGYIENLPLTETCHLHPLLFLPKGSNDVRLVCDLTEVNSYFEHVSGDLPGVDSVLRSIPSDWTYFAKLDLRNGYFRLPLHQEIRNFFGFKSGKNRWRFCVPSQGWLLSAGLFHDRIHRILCEFDEVSYVDDILLGASSLGRLRDKLRMILSRLAEYGLQIQRKKFVFGVTSINFPGFTINGKGIVSAREYLGLKEKES